MTPSVQASPPAAKILVRYLHGKVTDSQTGTTASKRSIDVNDKTFHTNLLDNLNTAVIVVDDAFCLFYINPAAEALFKISERRSRNLFLGEIIANPEGLIASLQSVQREEHILIARKVSLELHNQQRLIIDYTLTTINEVGNNFVLMEIQNHDLSWQMSRKEALMSTHETTLEMVQGLGHEIKNPLGGIRGAAQLLAEELESPELKDYTSIIINETDRLVRLIERLSGGYHQPELSLTNIHEVVERVRHLIKAECRGQILLVQDYDPSIPELSSDKEQLIQALLNITRNAMQALQESPAVRNPSITLKTRAVSHVTIAARTHRLAVRIWITDNGPGIKQALMDNIFYPLISGRAEGSGLGLSIAQAIINHHQGLIECESQPGSTTFMVTIPILTESNKS